MEDAAAELVHHAHVVNHLPYQVRGVEVQAKVLVGDDLPHLPPDGRTDGQVLAAGPLVVGEDHGAVLDGDLHTVVVGELYDGRPYFFVLAEVLLYCLTLVAAHEGADDGHLQHLGGGDHLGQVVDDRFTMLRVRV